CQTLAPTRGLPDYPGRVDDTFHDRAEALRQRCASFRDWDRMMRHRSHLQRRSSPPRAAGVRDKAARALLRVVLPGKGPAALSRAPAYASKMGPEQSTGYDSIARGPRPNFRNGAPPA